MLIFVWWDWCREWEREMLKCKNIKSPSSFFPYPSASINKAKLFWKEWRGGDKGTEDSTLSPTVGSLHSYSTLSCSSFGYIWLCLCVIGMLEEKGSGVLTVRKTTVLVSEKQSIFPLWYFDSWNIKNKQKAIHLNMPVCPQAHYRQALMRCLF